METQEMNQADLVPSAVQEFDFQNQIEMNLEFGLELPIPEMEFEVSGLTDL